MKHQQRSHGQEQHAAAGAPTSAAAHAMHNQPRFIPSPQDVALRAYFSFLKQGSEHGHDVKHWLEAETQLLMERTFARQLDHPGTPDLARLASPATETPYRQPRGSSHHVQS